MKTLFRVFLGTVISLEIAGILGAFPIASDFSWLGLAITTSFVWLALEYCQMPTSVWALACIGVVLDSGSSLLRLFSQIPYWDRPVHTFGGFASAAAMLVLALRALHHGHIRVRRRRLFLVAGVILGVSSAGFYYEVLEYLVDRFHYGSPSSLVSAYNTIEDQLFNTLGAVLLLAIYGCIEYFKPLRWNHEENRPADRHRLSGGFSPNDPK